MGKVVLSSQFVSGLLPEIKSKVAGSEGDFDALLAKARLEETKLRDLMLSQNKVFHVRRPNLGHSASRPPERMVTSEQRQVSAGTQKPSVRCYGCGAYGHYSSKCPAKQKGGPAEAPGRE